VHGEMGRDGPRIESRQGTVAAWTRLLQRGPVARRSDFRIAVGSGCGRFAVGSRSEDRSYEETGPFVGAISESRTGWAGARSVRRVDAPPTAGGGRA